MTDTPDWSHTPVNETEALQILLSQGVDEEPAAALIKSVRDMRGTVTRGDLFLIAMAYTMGAAQNAKADTENTGVAPDGISLPAVAPELYDDRADRSENPIDFMNRVWEPWLPVLAQNQLRKLDEKLIPAIKSYCQRRKIDAKTVLPPPKHVRLTLAALDETAWMDKLVQRQKSAVAELEKRYQRQK